MRTNTASSGGSYARIPADMARPGASGRSEKHQAGALLPATPVRLRGMVRASTDYANNLACFCRTSLLASRPSLLASLVLIRAVPTHHALQHVVGGFDGIHMPVVALDHMDRRSISLARRYTSTPSCRRSIAYIAIGMPEAIRRVWHALRPSRHCCIRSYAEAAPDQNGP